MTSATHDFGAEIMRALPDASLPEIEPDRLHRFPTSGKRGDDAGWCKLFEDLRGGVFGDFRSGLSGTWQAERDKFTPAEREAFRRRVEVEKREREAEQIQKHADAARKALSVWQAAHAVGPDHPYLVRKRVAPVETLREIEAKRLPVLIGYAPQAKGETLTGRVLVAPVKIGDKVSSVEFIDEAGRKSALAGGAKAGGHWAAQRLTDEVPRLLIGEGVATVLSAREATGNPAVAALSCGNLEAVVRAMRERYAEAALVILADIGNGQKDAEEAARAVGGLLAVPDFGDNRPDGAKDFNDLSALCGVNAVRGCIEAAKVPAVEIPSTPTIELLRGCDITPEPISWLWRGWLAAGKVHILGGAPGTGKTTIALAIAATLTIGGRWPDGTKSQVGNVVIWSGEDDPADTLIPRLKLMGADLTRVYFVSGMREGAEIRSFDPARDVDALRQKLDEIGDVHMLIVDPIVSAVAGDSHKNAEVRRSLQPLADLAANRHCALLGITHFSKGTSGREPVERITGSLAFGALARIVLVAAKHQGQGENEGNARLLLRAKSNIGPDDGGFEYELRQGEAYPGIVTSAVLWGKAVEGSARELLAVADATGDEADGQSAVDDAADWLRELLKDAGATDRRDILSSAKGAGYSERTIDRARSRLGVVASQHGFGKGKRSLWELPTFPPIPPNPPNSAKQKSMAGMNELGGNGDSSVVEAEI